jgi:KaiC/GvpD/RAD55 family RecA-like ATPase
MAARESSPTRLRTRISEAYWCDPSAGYAFKPATVSIALEPNEQVAWLDELFEGGIELPESDRKQALCIVITGPAGSGKSTLALELAYRWARHERLTSAYVLTEAYSEWVRRNVKNFGWKDGEAIFHAVSDGQRIQPNPNGQVILTDIGSLYDFLDDGILTAMLNFFGDHSLKKIASRLQLVPQVVVVDSLNTVGVAERKEIYDRLGVLMESGIKLLVLIGDSSPESRLTEPWEFAADVVLRLDSSTDSGGYLVRTIEIVKARYQSHVWGKHQLKLYGNPNPPKERAESDARLQRGGGGRAAHPDNRLKLRHHPYISQGGIFIYPSIHFVLSRYKTKSAITHDGHDYVPCPIKSITKLLGNKGFPRGRCTALVGDRGTHKSHLGYLQVMSGLLQGRADSAHRHRALIVSLRDDEGTTRETLARIVGELGAVDGNWTHQAGARAIDRLEQSGDLEITFYPPGFITPEEFFHRLLLSINRLKAAEHVHLSVLFNSLDQLSSRFPLCARHTIFIPGIIQMLTAEHITSYFVAGKDEQTIHDYGLLSMAELILIAERRDMDKADYLSFMNALSRENGASVDGSMAEWLSELDDKVQPVCLQVDRFAGGEPAGAYGVLELFEDKTSRIFKRRGLEFIPSTDRVRGRVGV